MTIESTIRDLNREYLDAMMHGDSEWFVHRLAPAFACIESDGTLRDKAGFVEKIASGPSFASWELDEEYVSVHSDVAMIRAMGRFTRADGTVRTSRYIDTYLLVDGEWNVITAQITLV